ncbi:hypothetical protein M378DRAFT_373789 [Amanita muscaria Koide BX008]|uniref:Uncharacterized protein n=1 Tax=Amanita muscaria (strain Koide BX008) TaxID=946122 RepID=A0A0C2WXY6_AMAMK|nr:hypothetical protein M378DRAFT_373789 [Amanita muscaria Koide BX008]
MLSEMVTPTLDSRLPSLTTWVTIITVYCKLLHQLPWTPAPFHLIRKLRGDGNAFISGCSTSKQDPR